MLRVRFLGKVGYRDAHALQRALFAESREDHLLLLEHPHVYTLGVRAKPEHVLVPPASVGADMVHTDRGGDVTYHGPGQLVGYPILTVPLGPDAIPRYVAGVEQVVIDSLADVGLPGAGRLPGYPGVWIDPGGDHPRKICAIGVRLTRGRSMHGFALNVDPDLAYFSHIVPCGIADKPVTSLRAEGVDATMAEVVDAVVARAVERWAPGPAPTWERQDVAWRVSASEVSDFTRGAPAGAGPAPVSEAREGEAAAISHEEKARQPGVPVTLSRMERRLARAGVDPGSGLAVSERKPPWLRVEARMGAGYRSLKATMRRLDLVTVCEEAGCPNIFECWADGTATFMINGDRCTRACGFCQVNTSKPLPLDPDEPEKVAEAVARLRLAHAVVTCVARDDLEDGGASGFAETIDAIRRRCPGT
ncbi:MAG: lipoyl(octanoyl) transferase LipB, partial [Acidimicrobiales bacterium]